MSGRRVLFLHPSDEPYGADKILVTMATGLKARGWEVGVAIADDVPEGWTSGQLRLAGISVVRAPLAPARRRYLRPVGIPGYAIRVLRARHRIRLLVREMHADVVHVNTSTLLAAALIGRPGGCRLVWHIHEIATGPRGLSLLFRAIPVLAADRVIAVSNATARNLEPASVARRRVSVIRNGIEDLAVAPLPRLNARPTVTYIGRLNRWKGYEIFVAAAVRTLAAGVDAKFVIAGNPPIGEEWRTTDLHRLVEGTGWASHFEVLGLHDDPPALLAETDVLVVPSTLPDPLPTIVIEGMSAGVPIVGSALGGIPEMIEDGETGILVPPSDPTALSDAIRRLLGDPICRDRMGAAARLKFTREFTMERFIDGVERCLGT